MASPLAQRLAELAGSTRVAVEDDRGTTSHAELVERATRAAFTLGGEAGLAGRRVALLARPDADWLAAFWGIVLAGGVAVPLSAAYPGAELAWFCADAGVDAAVVSAEHAALASELAQGRRVLAPEELFAAAPHPDVLDGKAAAGLDADAIALLLYTSGTTGKPKGAMITHGNVATQTGLLRDAWAFSAEDRLLHALPLHHLHGLGISLLTTNLAGAAARMLPRFDVGRVVAELPRATVFMAVPTMYHRLREQAGDDATLRAGARGLRLATSGSAALPVTLAEWWRGLAGAIPLERFGMTEIGVGFSNPLEPEARRAGSVGHALPTVEIRLVDEQGLESPHGPAEVWVRGPSVFRGYWGRPDASAAAFTDGWFRSGDVAERDADGYVRLLGRTSVDILKSGGYKLSALEIEEVLREHPQVAEVAVVGVPDESWGERVVAVVVLRAHADGAAAPEDLRAFAKERLASYKVPREIVVTDALPRNPMGKVVKPTLIAGLRR